ERELAQLLIVLVFDELAPFLDQRGERFLVGAVADETALLAQLDIVAFDIDRGQDIRAVTGKGKPRGELLLRLLRDLPRGRFRHSNSLPPPFCRRRRSVTAGAPPGSRHAGRHGTGERGARFVAMPGQRRPLVFNCPDGNLTMISYAVADA